MNYIEQRRLAAALRPRVAEQRGMTDTPDTTTMTGAEFMRHVGTDAAKWAEAFHAAYDRDRTESLARWFRDFAEVKIAEALRGETDTACQRTS